MSLYNIKVSIIVPIYNVEKYLIECLDSIVNQTYKNLEIILVDDGSTDSSSNICDRYASNDSRIVVIHKTNGGLADARDNGVKTITGDYAMFVDGDDWIDLNTINDCVSRIKESLNVDCLIFSYVKERTGSNRVNHIFDGSMELIDSDAKSGIYRRLFGPINKEMNHPEKLDYLSSCWGKLYKAEFIKQGKPFSDDYVGTGEDGLFNIYALRNVNKFCYIDKPFYHYRSNPASITSRYKKDFQKLWSNLFKEYKVFVSNNALDKEYQQSLENRIALSLVGITLNEMLSNDSVHKKIKATRKYINSKEYRAALKKAQIKYLPFAWKVLLICAKLRLAICVFVILAIGNARRGK